MTSAELAPLLQLTANTYALPLNILAAQVQQESGGDPNAVRYEQGFFERYIAGNPNAQAAKFGPFAACSVGLMQVMVETAYEMGFTGYPWELCNPRVSLSFGAKKMRELWTLAGGTDADYRTALAAYNGGAALLKVPEAQWPKPVQFYVKSIYIRVQSEA